MSFKVRAQIERRHARRRDGRKKDEITGQLPALSISREGPTVPYRMRGQRWWSKGECGVANRATTERDKAVDRACWANRARLGPACK